MWLNRSLQEWHWQLELHDSEPWRHGVLCSAGRGCLCSGRWMAHQIIMWSPLGFLSFSSAFHIYSLAVKSWELLTVLWRNCWAFLRQVMWSFYHLHYLILRCPAAGKGFIWAKALLDQIAFHPKDTHPLQKIDSSFEKQHSKLGSRFLLAFLPMLCLSWLKKRCRLKKAGSTCVFGWMGNKAFTSTGKFSSQ